MIRPIHKFVGDARDPGAHRIRDHVMCFMHNDEDPIGVIEVTTESKDVTCEDCIRLDSTWGYIKPLDDGIIELYIEWRTKGTIIVARHKVSPEDVESYSGFINDTLDLMVKRLDRMEEDFK